MGVIYLIVIGLTLGFSVRTMVLPMRQLPPALTALFGIVGALAGGYAAALMSGRPVVEVHLTTVIAGGLGALLALVAARQFNVRRASP